MDEEFEGDEEEEEDNSNINDQIAESVVPFIRAREAYSQGDTELILKETDLAIADLDAIIAKDAPPPPPKVLSSSSSTTTTSSKPHMPPPPPRRLTPTLPDIPSGVGLKKKKQRKSRRKPLTEEDENDEKLSWSFSGSSMF
jgi:hypothetical protein